MNATPLAPTNLSTSFPFSSRREIVSEEMALVQGRAWSLPAKSGVDVRVRALEGTLWITQEGDTADYLIGPGEVFSPARFGRVVIESLTETSRFVIVPQAG